MPKKRARKYKIVQCFKTKTAAKKKQKSMHNANKTASVVKNPSGSGYCVKSAGAKKRRKRTTQRK